MKSVESRILTINGGSSSIKFALFKAGDSLTLDEFIVTRGETEIKRVDGGGTYPAKTYQFERTAP